MGLGAGRQASKSTHSCQWCVLALLVLPPPVWVGGWSSRALVVRHIVKSRSGSCETRSAVVLSRHDTARHDGCWLMSTLSWCHVLSGILFGVKGFRLVVCQANWKASRSRHSRQWLRFAANLLFLKVQ